MLLRRSAQLGVFLALLSTGCAQLNDGLTPSVKTSKDAFDGSDLVVQPPVSAASSLSEAWHVMGMDWTSRTPDTVFVTAGGQGTMSIQSLAFNIDGRIVELQLASQATEFSPATSPIRASERRFSMSWADFKAAASAKDVKMRMGGINSYTVSSFGTGSAALIQAKLGPFIDQVLDRRKKLGRQD